MQNEITTAAAEIREIDTMLAVLAASPAHTRDALGMTALRLPNGVGITSIGADPSGFWNRVLGLGVSETVTRSTVDQAIGILADGPADFASVQVVPELLTEEWDTIAAHHGLTLRSSWYKLGAQLSRLATESSGPPTRPVGEDEYEQAGQLIGSVFGWSDEVAAAVYGSAIRSGALTGFAAYDGDTMIAAAAVALGGSTAHMYGAATLPEYRNRGAQSALLAARAAAARNAGCTWAIAETWVPDTEGANPSLNNMVRSGFEVLHRRDNWRWQRPAQ